MKKLLSLEELSQLLLALYLVLQIPNHISTYWLVAIFFLPDVFAVGFLINNSVGTIMYNFSHHKLVALSLVAIGFYTGSIMYLQLGYLFYAHTCFDRTIGYGLKYIGNPNKTHLGFIGKEKNKNIPDTF
ncbi:DUF4260 family protein [Parasediminibacterium sp. JCM 36343]|uniref:DUF4260 family protein n=1 Tax=Parasediminibacterium sp. JCM 36343 TaxID=3374279 RepID=UPI00397D9F25